MCLSTFLGDDSVILIWSEVQAFSAYELYMNVFNYPSSYLLGMYNLIIPAPLLDIDVFGLNEKVSVLSELS